jgi:hypothetical protein
MAKTSPTKRTLDYLRREGWTCEVVERWNAFARRRVDLFGGIDIVAVRGDTTLGVQCTTATNRSARIKKLRELPGVQAWIRAGNLLWVIDWRGPTKSRRTYMMTITEIEGTT